MLLILCTQILAVAATVTASAEVARGSRIFGGTNATKDDYPPIVSYSYWQKFSSGLRILEHICGATIIHPEWILTAAHCQESEDSVPMSTIRIRAGITNINYGKPPEAGEGDYKVEKIIIHPGFDGKNGNDDVALMKIKGKFEGREITVLDDSKGELKGEATAIGWGKTDKTAMNYYLMKVTDQLCEVELEANNSNVADTPTAFTPPELAKEQLICFGSRAGRGTCVGDSGGPLIMGPHKIQIGLTSFGHARYCGTTRSYFQRVSYRIPWIEKNIGAKVKVSSKLNSCAGIFPPIFSFLVASSMILVKLLN